MDEVDLHAYQAAREGSAFYVQTGSGLLELVGDDRRQFLQRQTTNDVALLAPERALLTVLTSPTARILDVFYLIEEPQGIEILPLAGRRAWTLQYLRSRIFFMDKVSLADRSAEIIQLDLLGPAAGETLRQLGLAAIPETNRLVRHDLESHRLKVIALEPAYGAGFRILVPSEAREELPGQLASLGAVQISAPEYEILRVEAGLPGADSELSEEYTPYEVGLSPAVSGSKGCYTGQEVLARQATYDKITQSLRGLRLSAPAEAGWRLRSLDGRPAGRLTTYVSSPTYGAIGLGVIRRPHDQAGTVLQAGEEPASELTGEVVSLPFA